MIQLVIKTILGAFNIKPTTEDLNDDVNGKSMSSALTKV
jgi:hypothetical protein